MDTKIELLAGVCLAVMFGVLAVLSVRYMMYNDYVALNCDFNSLTHEIVSCK